MFHSSASLRKIVMIIANMSGLMVGLSMLLHGRMIELALGVSVISGHLANLFGEHAAHDPNHVVVHRSTEDK